MAKYTNKNRAERADKALKTYAADDYPGYQLEDKQTVMQDLFTDLRHLAKMHNIDFNQLIINSYSHYMAERLEDSSG